MESLFRCALIADSDIFEISGNGDIQDFMFLIELFGDISIIFEAVGLIIKKVT